MSRPALLTVSGAEAGAVWQSNRNIRPISSGSPVGTRNLPQPTARRRTVRSLPAFIEPQLAKIRGEAPSGTGWDHEIKLDGYRLQIFRPQPIRDET